MMYGYVYKVTNVDTGSFYIGKHKYIKDEQFMDYLGSSSHPDFDLNNFDRKCFVKEKLEDAESCEQLTKLERSYILKNINVPGNVNSVLGIGYGGQYNYTDDIWRDKSSNNGEFVEFCPKCGKSTYHYKNGACKSCIARISYETSSANTYFKKTYADKYCPKCEKVTRHSGKHFENCSSCYNHHGYNLVKCGDKISLRNGTNIIVDDVSFIFNVTKDGNTFTMPEGLFVTDGDNVTSVKKLIRNDNISNWLQISVVGTSHHRRVLTVTEDHPFVTDFSDFVKARDLNIGDNLISANGTPVRIENIEKLERTAHSYDIETESGFFDFSNIRSRNCRTRVIGDVWADESGPVVPGRGNLSFTSINLPRLAIKSKGDLDEFYNSLNLMMESCAEQLLHRYYLQCNKTIKNYPFLMGQGVWLNSSELGVNDTLEDVLKHGTLSIGFIGLAETLVALTGKHHGESEESQKLGLEIISFMRRFTDDMTKKYHLNFSLLATPAEGLSGRFVRIDKERFGIIEGVTDRDYYTNSFHVPVYYPISAFEKIKIEAPYHELTNAGHISYIELDGDPSTNLQAFEQIIRCMKENGIGYGSVNHPVDRDPVCGYVGIIGDTCPCCGRSEGEALTPDVYRNILATNRSGGVYGK